MAFLIAKVLPERVGLAHGNKEGGLDFNVILPSGQICPGELSRLPRYDVGEPVYLHSVTEEAGVIYLCGGVNKAKANIGMSTLRRIWT